jgi:hypothetical protein
MDVYASAPRRDKAHLRTLSDGRQGTIMLKGDAVHRADWNPAAYDVDTQDFGTQLAGKTLEGMFLWACAAVPQALAGSKPRTCQTGRPPCDNRPQARAW